MRLALLIVLFGLNYAIAQTPPAIMIDHSQCQPVYPYDAGPSGVSYFVDKVIRPNYLFFDFDLADFEGGNIFDEDKLQNTIIVVPPTIHKKFTTIKIKKPTDTEFKDVLLYDYWLEHGANIVFIAEHENYYFNATNINSVTEKYGIHVNSNAVKQGADITGNWPMGQSKWFGIDSLKFYLPASLKCAADAQVWATIDTAVVCASVAAGKGTVTVITDYELFWNMTPEHGIHYGNNARFLSTIFNELLEKADSAELVDYNPSFIYSYYNEDEAFLGYKFVDYKQVDPTHINPKDIVVFDRPIEYINWPDSVFNKIKKALIICDANSNYFGMLQKEGGQGVLDVLGYKHQRLPINLIARQFGIQFSESIVCDGNINDMHLPLKGVGLMHRICEYPSYKYTGSSMILPLTVGNKVNGKIIARADSGSVEIDYNSPLGFDESLGPDTTLRISNAKPATGAIMAYSDKRVFAISGRELKYQLFQADYSSLRQEFIKWLKE